MSGLTLSAIREALAVAIRGASEEINVEAYPNSEDPPPPPSFVIHAAADNGYIDYFVTMGGSGLSTVRFEVKIDPSAEGSDYGSRWMILDDFLSVGTGNASSVIDAIMTDATLGLSGCVARITDLFVDRDAVTATLAVEVTINKVGAAP